MLLKIEDDHCVIHGAENEHAQFVWLTMVLKSRQPVIAVLGAENETVCCSILPWFWKRTQPL